MKRKLVAALLSVAMVASITPVSALGPVATVEAAETNTASPEDRANAVSAFKQAMEKLPMSQDLSLITTDSVAKAFEFYQNAQDAYEYANSIMATEDYTTEVNALIQHLKDAKARIIEVYGEKMIADINDAAQQEKVTENTVFTEIEEDEEALAQLGVTDGDLKVLVTNYTKYENAQIAVKVDKKISQVINGTNGVTQVDPVNDPAGFVTAVDNLNIHIGDSTERTKIADLPEDAKKLAAGYKTYLEAKAKVDQTENADEIVEAATTRLVERTGVLENERTSKRVEEAEAALTKAAADVKDVLDKASADVVKNYNDAVKNLKALVSTVNAELKLQSEADEYSKEIDTLHAKTITLDDIVAIEKLSVNLEKYEDQLTADSKTKALNILGQWKRLVAATPDEDVAFTNAVIKAFPVPEIADVKHTSSDKAAIEAALEKLVDAGAPTIGGVNIADKLAKEDSAYISAVSKIVGAKAKWDVLDAQAKAAEDAFKAAIAKIKNDVFAENNVYDWHDHLGTAKGFLDAAKAQYDALDDISKKRVADEYKTLTEKTADYETYIARLNEETIIAKLTSGLKAIESKVNNKKLTLADQDLVYGYRDDFAILSKNAQNDFKTKHVDEYATLTAAINQIDNLVVADLEKQIDALVKVKPDATLAEIQAAKAANEAAREAYEALTDTQQGAVNNFKLIGVAEKAVEEAEVAYVKAQIGEIVKLDLSKLTIDQAKNIIEVQNLISGMTQDQKDQILALQDGTVGNADYKKALIAAAELVKKAASLENATISAVADQTYTGEDIQPAVEVKDMSGAVIAASEYKVAYKNNVDAGTATVVVSAVDGSQYTGTKELEFTIKPADASGAVVSAANVTYTGEELETTVKVVLDGKTLKAGTDYDVTYADTTKVGKATATVAAKGNYAGTITKNFVVKPGKSAVTSFKAGTKKAVVKFNGQPGASYKIAYALAGTTQYKYAYTTSLSKTLTGLKSGRTYKVKVLAYYKADGKTYYTGYGSYKTVKVK